ncbi:hypothetical protein TPL01_21020 [Sulfuriferula plumbiphila]|uniref:Integrase DNA-binding domain-containing protein n=1 Tax=Sulfuriferula plumbiphila TaxID=171865 RepID=A0A512L912_9PROT|nr:Arm DNA-binding domain-containing protein [Sulfuriferula plumbiphila]BBP04419.1 hypothetical protein SFPGR_18410 [Sulfuriferula plumbiphila]GEP30964.1 hypothetical protein TPL01_21020 [Sulfuriferula plumbiphila]
MASIKLLSARQIDTLGDGNHADGGNLYLRVKGNARSWVFRYKQAGKVRKIGMARHIPGRWLRHAIRQSRCAGQYLMAPTLLT